MSVKLSFTCGGCHATAEGRIGRRHEVLQPAAVIQDGMTFDRCLVVTDKVEDAAPKGWMVFDPYTFCTYCPDCWHSIEEAA